MVIRKYSPADLAEIERLHDALGFDYKMPNLDNSHLCCQARYIDDNGIVMAMGLQSPRPKPMPGWTTAGEVPKSVG